MHDERLPRLGGGAEPGRTGERPCDGAAATGGDVAGTDDVSVPLVPAVEAGEIPTSLGA